MAENAAKSVISIPTPESESPPWLRVGVLAGVGLAVGLLWPRVVGLKLGPSAPADVASANLGQAPAAAVPERKKPGSRCTWW